jgi:hypothetical protein
VFFLMGQNEKVNHSDPVFTTGKRHKKVEVECAWCGEKFMTIVYKDGTPRGHFCPDKNCRVYFNRALKRKKVTARVVTE